MNNGYALSYQEFLSLLKHESTRLLVESWFAGNSLTGDKNLKAVHEAIQANNEMQYKLYQAAMNIWR